MSSLNTIVAKSERVCSQHLSTNDISCIKGNTLLAKGALPLIQTNQLMMTNDNVDDDVRVLVVIGNTGDGKSTFLNLLMNNENAFQEGISADPITEKTSVKECQWKNEKLLLCDTQGISDSQNLDNENIKQMALELKQLPYINMIILIINGSNVRVSVYLQETIKLFINIFSKQIFNHLIIAFTHWSLDQNDDTDESNIENDYNEKISKMFHITKHIPCFFIDSCYNRLNKRGKYTYDNEQSIQDVWISERNKEPLKVGLFVTNQEL
ncbi:unnamed protein product [Didymodactylos carnosus]|uniref:AIG1-type G domain-containing protein n=1 Tax=Didymodactylos carnosus TaxID=1234261 RepID=A0A815CZ27_9BILA|nr:unnamed protein product [Didymodactylos carnosus]CAF4095406.1 unnamed protein product [Didymodactylos carnosus]